MSGQESKGQERLNIRREEYRRRSSSFGIYSEKVKDIARNRLNLSQQLALQVNSAVRWKSNK
jgi:hypothetical protein